MDLHWQISRVRATESENAFSNLPYVDTSEIMGLDHLLPLSSVKCDLCRDLSESPQKGKLRLAKH